MADEGKEDKLLTKFDLQKNQCQGIKNLPQTSLPPKFGGEYFDKIFINYISDIHLGHHRDSSTPMKPQIRKIVRELVESERKGLTLFGGDIAVDRCLCTTFYREYMTRRQYEFYKYWRKNIYLSNQ